MGMKLQDTTIDTTTRYHLEQKPHIPTMLLICKYLIENRVEKAYYGTNMVLLHKDHAPLVICTHFVLISFNIFIYMLTY